MGIVGKGAKCNVSGCENDAVRSLNTGKVEDAGSVSYTHLTLPTKA